MIARIHNQRSLVTIQALPGQMVLPNVRKLVFPPGFTVASRKEKEAELLPSPFEMHQSALLIRRMVYQQLFDLAPRITSAYISTLPSKSASKSFKQLVLRLQHFHETLLREGPATDLAATPRGLHARVIRYFRKMTVLIDQSASYQPANPMLCRESLYMILANLDAANTHVNECFISMEPKVSSLRIGSRPRQVQRV